MKKKSVMMVAAVAGLLGLGGCYSIQPAPVSKFDKTGKGVMYAAIDFGANPSAKSLCEAAADANGGVVNDERCKSPSAYYGKIANYKAGGSPFPLLIPVNVKVSGGDIVKVQLVDGAPGIYQGTFGRIMPGFQRSEPCYDNGNPFSGGIECPALNWSYKDFE